MAGGPKAMVIPSGIWVAKAWLSRATMPLCRLRLAVPLMPFLQLHEDKRHVAGIRIGEQGESGRSWNSSPRPASPRGSARSSSPPSSERSSEAASGNWAFTITVALVLLGHERRRDARADEPGEDCDHSHDAPRSGPAFGPGNW